MSNYAIMSAEKYEEIKASLELGHRKSIDCSKVVAKLKPDQVPPNTEIHNHNETLVIMATPEWSSENLEGE